jgi:hypothetical protein
VGHAVGADSGSALRKPSVIYPHAKSAADVPLTILRENAVSSLYQLSKLTGNAAFSDSSYIQTLCGLSSLNFERGLALPKENDAKDLIIRNLLYLLSSAMAQERLPPPQQHAAGQDESLLTTSSPSTTSCFSSCLHVLEYLVRRYDLHGYSIALAEHWLVTMLPHHEHALFLRVLQLVDLASLPAWIFLRPYAAAMTTTGNTQQVSPHTTPPTRSYLARQVAQHTPLVQHVCQLAKRMAQIHAQEVMAATTANTSLSAWPPLATRRGVSHVLSFCAAVLVEALQWQSTKTGTLDEATIRILLPYLLTACGGNGDSSGHKKKKNQKQIQLDKWSLSVTCPEYRGWGHVLASCIVELGVLSGEVQQFLLHTLMQGALEMDRACCVSNSDNRHDGHWPEHRVEAAADSILVILSVLVRLPHSDHDNDGNHHTHKTFLRKVRGLSSQQQQQQQSSLVVMGYPCIAQSTIKDLSEWEALVPAVTYVYGKMDMDVTNLVAATLVASLHRMVEFMNTKPKKMERALSVILQLVSCFLLVQVKTKM